MLRDLAAFHLFRTPIPIFVSLVDIRLRVSCDFAAVKFCLSEGIHAGTTSLVRACGERRNSPKLKNPSSSYISFLLKSPHRTCLVMAIVIVGGGIIGIATAYYLSESHSNPSSIHIIESAPRLFASASGYAGGFLAKDWFSAPVAPLGELSFNLHRQLAQEYHGQKRWGYAPSTALSLAIDEGRGAVRGEDWLLGGTSRAGVSAVAGEGGVLREDGTPGWLTSQKGRAVETIGSADGCAQVEPRQLCEFLMEKCLERGVQLHMPARATGVVRREDGTLNGIVMQNDETNMPATIECESIVLAAGAWTPSAFTQLFPESKLKIPISPLAGHSINVHSPRHALVDEERYGGCHAIFAAPSRDWNFAPEAISRMGGEIFVGGLNSEAIPLPRLATDTKIDPKAIEELKKVTVKLVGLATPNGEEIEKNDLKVTREALCFRPVTRSGTPILARIEDKRLGNSIKMAKGGGVYVAAGHGPWGISLSLGTGKIMAEMVQGIKTRVRVDGLGVR
jgi:glycine/D-amino acid oxidase-like deaminating enzyme